MPSPPPSNGARARLGAADIVLLVVLALDAISAVLLVMTAQSPQQDAAGRGMAQGFAGLTVTIIVASLALWGVGAWLGLRWLVWLAVVVALVPAIITILPALL